MLSRVRGRVEAAWEGEARLAPSRFEGRRAGGWAARGRGTADRGTRRGRLCRGQGEERDLRPAVSDGLETLGRSGVGGRGGAGAQVCN